MKNSRNVFTKISYTDSERHQPPESEYISYLIPKNPAERQMYFTFLTEKKTNYLFAFIYDDKSLGIFGVSNVARVSCSIPPQALGNPNTSLTITVPLLENIFVAVKKKMGKN